MQKNLKGFNIKTLVVLLAFSHMGAFAEPIPSDGNKMFYKCSIMPLFPTPPASGIRKRITSYYTLPHASTSDGTYNHKVQNISYLDGENGEENQRWIFSYRGQTATSKNGWAISPQGDSSLCLKPVTFTGGDIWVVIRTCTTGDFWHLDRQDNRVLIKWSGGYSQVMKIVDIAGESSKFNIADYYTVGHNKAWYGMSIEGCTNLAGEYINPPASDI